MNHSVTLSRSIQASAEAAFRSLSTAGGLLDWCAHAAHCDAREDGYFFFWNETGYQCSGVFYQLEENACLGIRVAAPFEGQLRFLIKPAGEGAQVSLQIQSDDTLENQISFWDDALNNLKAVLETGLDRRIYDRPMLGILIGGLLTQDQQERFGVPVDYGIVISGTVSGMGAAALGLAENDVLVEMNGVDVRDYHALPQALGGRKAGDRSDVTWYRGGEKKTGSMILSGRPTPYTPTGPAELADHVQGIYHRLDAELAELLDDVNDSEASFRPAEKEWNSKEIIAHTIVTERAAQLWIANTLQGKVFSEWSTNDHSLVKALVDVYPSAQELAAVLQRTESETIAMLRRLPPELTTIRGLYMNVVSNFGEYGLPVHTRMHYETIRELIVLARKNRA